MQRRLFLAAVSASSAALIAAPARAQQAPSAIPATAGDRTYRIYADVCTSGEGAGIQGIGCVNQTVFFPGDIIVFRAVIADGASGTPLTADDVKQRGVTAVVALSDGTTVPMRLGIHPPPAANASVHASFWSGSTKLAPTHPTGTLKWNLMVKDAAGRTTSFETMGQIGGVTVLTIAQKAAAPAQR